ncbi:hypothetical protein PAXRUDRAFT_508963 [Paxillus rubicundulus Ve08.2h10]|uniref:Uncharacterized protein n=1 Tax=Paxillus rubicundulus Ve08.2h10 TaxID=930991 RepID=A0A0D0DVJ8_9AGAM|nr:hypothetical protein PAXRUDRAFT_508963 [Paxillus rubicundulus Ve08.2h10]
MFSHKYIICIIHRRIHSAYPYFFYFVTFSGPQQVMYYIGVGLRTSTLWDGAVRCIGTSCIMFILPCELGLTRTTVYTAQPRV